MTTNNWREKFSKDYTMKNFALYNKEKDIPVTNTEMIYLIQDLLNTQREEIIDAIQNHKDNSDCCYDNPCIKDIINKIK